MRESKIYLNFFHRNLIIFIISIVFSFILGWAINQVLPEKTQLSSIYQINYTDGDILQKTSVADEAVTILRSQNLQQQLEITSKTTIFKSGPVLITITTENNGLVPNLQSDQDKLTGYLKNNYPVTQIGQPTYETSKVSLYLVLGVSLVFGFSLGLLISLVKTYLQNY